MANYYGHVACSGDDVMVCASGWDTSFVVVRMFGNADGAVRVRIELGNGAAPYGHCVFDGTMDEFCRRLTGMNLSERLVRGR